MLARISSREALPTAAERAKCVGERQFIGNAGGNHGAGNTHPFKSGVRSHATGEVSTRCQHQKNGLLQRSPSTCHNACRATTTSAAGTLHGSNCYHHSCPTTIRRHTLSFLASSCGFRYRQQPNSFPQVSIFSCQPPICDFPNAGFGKRCRQPRQQLS